MKIKDIKIQEKDGTDERKGTRTIIAELLKEPGNKLELTAHANRVKNNPNLKTVDTEVTHLTQIRHKRRKTTKKTHCSG